MEWARRTFPIKGMKRSRYRSRALPKRIKALVILPAVAVSQTKLQPPSGRWEALTSVAERQPALGLAALLAAIELVIERLRHDYDKPLQIDSLARKFGMRPLGFHEHFKALTAMSPLQFQKQPRHQATSLLMLGEDWTPRRRLLRGVFCMGYEDASHFTREYERRFGEPPMRDGGRLRQEATITAVA